MAAACVYIHVPFCEQKCTYCDFYTVRGEAGAVHPLAGRWFELLRREMLLWAQVGALSREDSLRTVYFGGGTPSLTDAATLRAFLDFVRDEFATDPDLEVTIEMQPGTAGADKIGAYADAGVTRFSVGVQTFDPAVLEVTGRRHTIAQSRDMIRDTAAAGLLSIDLIAAWPGQTAEMWRREMEEALSHSPAHISAYELTFKEGTDLHRRMRAGITAPLDEDARAGLFADTERLLAAAGLPQYEISNYARPGAESRHNSNYWELGDYVGLGAGAHSMVHPHRYLNPHSVDDYARATSDGRLFRRTNDAQDPDIGLAENIHMALRLNRGFDMDWFASRTGVDVRKAKQSALGHLEEAGLVERTGNRLRLTAEGRLRADSVTGYFL
jgi:oxygen-independent coproporphyrinogen-3 oxidase